MTVALVAYDEDNTTQVGTLATARSIRFENRANVRGSMSFTWTPADDDAPATACLPHVWIRVRIDGTDVAAYRVLQPERTHPDSPDGSPDDKITAVGALAAGDSALVYPQGGIGNDYRELSATRWFGFMSDSYDDTAWVAAAEVVDSGAGSYDVWDTPFGNLHDGWPDPAARYLWSDDADYTNPDLDGPEFPTGEVWFRKEFTVASEVDVAVAVSCNDEFELYLDGALLASESEPTSRDTSTIEYVTVSAGTHLLAARGENIDYIDTGKRPAWLLVSVLEAPYGRLSGDDQLDEVHVGAATSGTFTLTVDGDTTRDIPWDASSSTVRDALIDVMFPRELFVGNRIRPSDGDLEVTGAGQSGDPWKISWIGWRTARRSHTITADSTSLTGDSVTITNTQTAVAPTQVVTGDSGWKCLPYPAEPPGVTFGAIVVDLVGEAVARGAGPGLNGTNVTATVDSDAVAWPFTVQLGLPVGRSVERALQTIVDSGADVAVDATGTVDAWARRGTDLSGTVTLTAGGASANAAGTHTQDGATANTLLTFHKGGWVETVKGSGSRRESHLQLGTVSTDDDAAVLASSALNDLSRGRSESTFTVDDGIYGGPGTADVCDIVSATDFDGTAVDQRIMAITGNVDDDTGDVTWELSTVPDLVVRRGRDRLTEGDFRERVATALDLMSPGTVGGRIRTASPVRYVTKGSARAAIATSFFVDPIADQTSYEGDVYAYDPLVVAAIADQSWAEDETITSVAVSATGGADPLTLSVTGLPTGLSLTDNGDGTGSIDGTVDSSASGSSPYTVTVTATDANSNTDDETFTATVTAPVTADPGPFTVALVTETTSHAAATNTKSALEANGHTVTRVDDANAGTTDFSSYDAIVAVRIDAASATSLASIFRAEVDAGRPLLLPLVEEGRQSGTYTTTASEMGLCGTADLEASSDNEMVVTDNTHPIMDQWTTGRRAILTAVNYAGAITSGQTHLGDALATGDPDDLLAGLVSEFAVPSGTTVDGTATGAAIFVSGHLYGGQSGYTADGATLLDEALVWAVNN